MGDVPRSPPSSRDHSATAPGPVHQQDEQHQHQQHQPVPDSASPAVACSTVPPSVPPQPGAAPPSFHHSQTASQPGNVAASGSHFHEPHVHFPSLGPIATALPSYPPFEASPISPHAPQSAPRLLSGVPSSAIVYPFHQPQFSPHAHQFAPPHSPYGAGFAQGPYHHNYPPSMSAPHVSHTHFQANAPRLVGPAPPQHPFHQYAPPTRFPYYGPPHPTYTQYAPGFADPVLQPGVVDRRASAPASQSPMPVPIIDRPSMDTDVPSPAKAAPTTHSAGAGPSSSVARGMDSPIGMRTALGSSGAVITYTDRVLPHRIQAAESSG